MTGANPHTAATVHGWWTGSCDVQILAAALRGGNVRSASSARSAS